MTDTPEPGWRPDPDGGDFSRWFDGKHFTKRVQGEPPKSSAKKTTAPAIVAEQPELESIPFPAGSVKRRPPKPVVEPVESAKAPEPEEDEETPDATAAVDWPLPSTVAAVVSGLGIVGAFLLPLGRLPLVIAALGVVGSGIALALAVVANERRFVAVWGIGLGLVGIAAGVTISMLD